MYHFFGLFSIRFLMKFHFEFRHMQAAGGGTVLFPSPGIYLTGSFSLVSNLILQIPVGIAFFRFLFRECSVHCFSFAFSGAVIQGTHDPNDYPLVEALPSYPFDSVIHALSLFSVYLCLCPSVSLFFILFIFILHRRTPVLATPAWCTV